MNLVSIFFFSLGITFFILLFISAFNPALINKLNRSLNKSYEDLASEQLTRSLAALMVICFITGIVIYLFLNNQR